MFRVTTLEALIYIALKYPARVNEMVAHFYGVPYALGPVIQPNYFLLVERGLEKSENVKPLAPRICVACRRNLGINPMQTRDVMDF